MSEKRRPGASIQSLVFDRARFSARTARTWAAAHGFRTPATDPKPRTLRLRQESPGGYQKGSFRTITLAPGVKAVVGRKKKK